MPVQRENTGQRQRGNSRSNISSNPRDDEQQEVIVKMTAAELEDGIKDGTILFAQNSVNEKTQDGIYIGTMFDEGEWFGYAKAVRPKTNKKSLIMLDHRRIIAVSIAAKKHPDMVVSITVHTEKCNFQNRATRQEVRRKTGCRTTPRDGLRGRSSREVTICTSSEYFENRTETETRARDLGFKIR